MLGLGFGDCGKGHFIDVLARRWQAHTVVRFNGGAQAGHNVVTPAEARLPARHHTYSQFGSGTFVPGVRTLLLDPVVVHPTALLVEAGVLGQTGIDDALPRLTIDAMCRVTTPYHQAAGRLRELLRGATAHGTCGVGVGETVRHSLEHPDQVLRYGDFSSSNSANLHAQRDKLSAIRQSIREEFEPLVQAMPVESVTDELAILRDESLPTTWLNHCRALARQCPPASASQIHEQLTRPGCVLFEGAQGVLLDEWRGFHPHTTWSSTTAHAVNHVASRYGVQSDIEHYGVLRSYLTRHGIGPMPTHDATLDAIFPEPHNHAEGWQGQFRRGHPDAVLLRYALESAGALSGLLIGHLDVFERDVKLKWCERYDGLPDAANSCERLPLGEMGDLAHQEKLTEWLYQAQPQYAEEAVTSAAALLERIAGVTDVPVILRSYGPTSTEVVSGEGK